MTPWSPCSARHLAGFGLPLRFCSRRHRDLAAGWIPDGIRQRPPGVARHRLPTFRAQGSDSAAAGRYPANALVRRPLSPRSVPQPPKPGADRSAAIGNTGRAICGRARGIVERSDVVHARRRRRRLQLLPSPRFGGRRGQGWRWNGDHRRALSLVCSAS